MRQQSARELLKWYVEAGVDELIDETPSNRFAEQHETIQPNVFSQNEDMARKSAALSSPGLNSPKALAEKARKMAEAASDLDELRAAVEKFDGLAIKKTANKTVFAEGNPKSGIVFIGEAPGAQEDIEGRPFCGASGKVLDKMLVSIGLDRTKAYITNTIFWRPPGNRKPTNEELAACLPFVEKHLEFLKPKVIVLVGATAVLSILKQTTSMGKLRQHVHKYSNQYLKSDVPVLVTYHPSFLMRAPINKKLAWDDMLMLKKFLEK